MRALLFIFLLMPLSACLKVTDMQKEGEVQPVTPSPVEPHVQELDGPNKYEVILPVQEGVQVARRYLGDTSKSVEALPAKIQNASLVDDQVQAGQTYVYQLGYVQDGSFHVLSSYELKIPMDMLIDKEVSLQQDEDWSEFRRIFLKPGGVITTNGHHLAIHADQIHSEEGLIRTFPAGLKAADGQAGLGGGSIEISVRTGKGNLKVELRGQQGGKGGDGKATLHQANGNSTGYNYDPVHPWNNPPPIPKGQPGGAGSSGLAGGNSGKVEIKIGDNHELSIDPLLLPGEGGPGGGGGPGEPAGDGVLTAGDKGPDGALGPTGARENLCIQDVRGYFCR